MEIPYTVTARPDTGLYNAKVGIWLFLASEVMLFGGLFSGYVFLRIGAHDFPWPFHELDVLPGFINTMILIGSSVTVVAAWAALKARRYEWFRINMIITLLCALGFMGIKSYEYSQKFAHYSITLKDGTVIDGHPAHATEQAIGDAIAFGELTTVSVNLEKATLSFLEHLRVNEGDKPYSKSVAGKPLKVTTATGEQIELSKEWLKRERKRYFKRKSEVAAKATDLERRLQKGENVQAEREALEKEWPAATITLNVAQGSGLSLLVTEHDIARYTPEQVIFRDDSTVSGKLVRDVIPFNPDKIDLRMVKNPEKSLAWKYFPELKDTYLALHEKKTAEFKEKHKKYAADYENNADWAREAKQLNIKKDLPKEQAEALLHDHSKAANIERGDKRHYTNFSPSRSPYYAIYFLMTGLHGLHVIGGAVVLGYFLFTGKKMYQRNPEHLANRVEVGGLFWHFVDLVWIFLFPVFYLM